MTSSNLTLSATLFLALSLPFALAAQPQNSNAELSDKPQHCDPSYYAFGWSSKQLEFDKPRGGTTQGAAVEFARAPSAQWQALQDEKLSKQERDRQAILAMAGAYKVSFDFMETVGYTPDFKPAQPYHSWGTEYVYVVEDKPDFVSLQHIMVMVFTDEEGNPSDPMVMKHWRQDWQYEKARQWIYQGYNTWKARELPSDEVAGSWSQSVYQVDDAPRYEAHGWWEHQGNISSWRSTKTWRPLPRRESSVRSDYQVLEGFNRHTITPTGWVQEEENLKLVLDKDHQPVAKYPYLAKEMGVARYERIVNHDFKPSDEYWQQTREYWADVRQFWLNQINSHQKLVINSKHDNKYRFMLLFGQADAAADGDYQPGDGAGNISQSMAPYLQAQ